MKYEYTFPNSKMLTSCSYDSEEHEMTVTFTGGKDYVFIGVDKGTYDDLINAESAGKHFNKIKAGLVRK